MVELPDKVFLFSVCIVYILHATEGYEDVGSYACSSVDLAVFTDASSPSDCHQLCRHDHRCRAGSHDAFNRSCTTKSSCAAPFTNQTSSIQLFMDSSLVEYLDHPEYTCDHNVLSVLVTVSSSFLCKFHCELEADCVGVLYSQNDCILMSSCSYPLAANLDYDLHMKKILPGWSLYEESDCGGNNLVYFYGVSIVWCARECSQRFACIASVYEVSNGNCYLKTWCVMHANEGIFTYKFADMTAAGYREYKHRACDSSLTATLTAPITATYLCVDACARTPRCSAFAWSQDGMCSVYTDCGSNSLSGSSDGRVYIPLDVDRKYRVYEGMDCSGPDIELQYTTVPDPRQCVAACEVNQACANIVYDVVGQRCHIRGQCVELLSDTNHTVLARRERALTECWGPEPVYAGPVNTTVSGRHCQPWTCEHASNRQDNFCQSTQERPQPWCYTDENYTAWEYCDVPVCHSQPAECLGSDQGREYQGTNSKTTNGIDCQPWGDQIFHSHSFSHEHFIDNVESVAELGNLCRNPDGVAFPWCYTMDAADRWNYCDLTVCEIVPSTCKVTERGEEYVGGVSVTQSGRPCQRWDSQTPHPHALSAHLFPDNLPDLSSLHNFCRNFENDTADGPYCLTTDPTVVWETCDVRMCQDKIGGYGYYRDKECGSASDVAHFPSAEVLQCQATCDVTDDCHFYEMNSTGCHLKSDCSLSDHSGVGVYMKYDYDGWSLTWDTDCPGSDISTVVTVTSIYQCLDMCAQDSRCIAVLFKRETFFCWTKYYCRKLTPIKGYVNYRKVPLASNTDFSVTEGTWCVGEDQEMEYLGIPSAADCRAICSNNGACDNAIYDRLRHVCYVKGACEAYEVSVQHTLYSRSLWSEWSAVEDCGAGWSGRRRRTCSGASCAGRGESDGVYCQPALSHGHTRARRHTRLSRHLIRTLTTHLTHCLFSCQLTLNCHSVNVRQLGSAAHVLCQLNTALSHCERLNDFLVTDLLYDFYSLPTPKD